MDHRTSQFLLPDLAAVPTNRRDTEFVFPPPRFVAAKAGWRRRTLPVWVALVAGLICWSCLGFFREGPTGAIRLNLVLPVVGGLGLAAMAATVGLLLHGRQAAAENLRLTEANERLLKERDLLRTIIDNLPDYVYAKDREGRFLLNNPAHAVSMGAASPKEMKGKSDFDFFPRELAQQFHDDEQQIIATAQSVINQEQFKFSPGFPNAAKRWSLTSKVIWRGPEGEVLGTVGITRDIHDLKRTQEALRQSEEQLRQSAAQLEQSNRELQDFAYVASHDLQEPLRKIVVFGERLKEKCGEALPPEPRDYVERMQKAAARMQNLINDLLTFSRLSTRTHPFAPVNLADIVRGVLEDLESRIEQSHGCVEVGDLPVLDADALQMRQLLQNLIGNALKFHRRDQPPVVQVTARQLTDATGVAVCELTVRDHGIGFDEKYLDRIFNVFQRLHSRNEYEGTGMGLAIVRKIVLHHGGRVTAHSRVGEGAAFVVTLPVKHTAGAASPTYQI